MKTALITGASSGIGLEFSRVFAANNNNLVLVARSEDKLQELASEIRRKHNVEVQVIAADLSEMAEVQKVHETCERENIVVDYLVNNAGFGSFLPFAETDWEVTGKMIDLNVKALARLCNLFIPGMVKRKSGRILNVASTAAFQPGPNMAVYFASKSFVLFLSEALYSELKGTGVSVTCLCPGATESGFIAAAAMENSNLFANKNIPSSLEVAEFGYKAMMRGEMTVIHGLLNKISATAVRFAPRKLVLEIAKKITGDPHK